MAIASIVYRSGKELKHLTVEDDTEDKLKICLFFEKEFLLDEFMEAVEGKVNVERTGVVVKHPYTFYVATITDVVMINGSKRFEEYLFKTTFTIDTRELAIYKV